MPPRKELTKQEASQLTSEEYNQLQLSYRSLYKSLCLTNTNSLRLTTLEDNQYVLQVTAEGWKVLGGGEVTERERTWEMVEDLLRSVSPLFAEGWNDQLMQKLQTVADQRDENIEAMEDVQE
jgi:hypothetical protein